jgi:hypothetical protein
MQPKQNVRRLSLLQWTAITAVVLGLPGAFIAVADNCEACMPDGGYGCTGCNGTPEHCVYPYGGSSCADGNEYVHLYCNNGCEILYLTCGTWEPTGPCHF